MKKFNNKILFFILYALLTIPYIVVYKNALVPFRCLSNFLFLLSITFFLKSFRKNFISNFFVLSLSTIYFYCSYSEIGAIFVKNTSFTSEFWTFLSFENVISAIKEEKLTFVFGGFCFVLFLLTLFKFIKNFKNQLSTSFKIKALFLGFFIVSSFFTFQTSSASSMINSYKSYQKEMASYDGIKYLRKIPSKNEITATSGKNIVHIIVESLGDVYTNEKRFPNLIPNLLKYKKQGIEIKHMLQTQNQGNSIMGITASLCGRYFHLPPKDSLHDICLGDVLKKAGYKNVFLESDDLHFSGDFEKLFLGHGFSEALSKEDFKKQGYAPDLDDNFSDKEIFNIALDKYKKLQKENKPFMLTIFTRDSHNAYKPLPESCHKFHHYNGAFKDSGYIQAFHCTDFYIGKFIKKLKALPNFNNLVITISGDHTQHAQTVASSINTKEIYTAFIGEDILPYKQKRKAYLMDIATTILSLANIKTNAKFYVGEDISKSFFRKKTTSKEINTLNVKNKSILDLFARTADEDINGIEETLKKTKPIYKDKNIQIKNDVLKGDLYSSYIFKILPLNQEIKKHIFALVPFNTANESLKKRPIFFTNINDNLFAISKMATDSKWETIKIYDFTSNEKFIYDIKTKKITKENAIKNIPPQDDLKSIYKTSNINCDQSFTKLKNKNEFFGKKPFASCDIDIPVLDKNKTYIVKIKIASNINCISQVFYQKEAVSKTKNQINPFIFTVPNENEVQSCAIYQGENEIYFLMPKGSQNRRIDFTPSKTPLGTFKFDYLEILELSKRE